MSRRFEIAVRGRTARVHDALGNALVVEVEDFLPQHKVFQQRRPAPAGLKAVLIVRDANALVGGEVGLSGPVRTFLGHLLVRFAAISAVRLEAVLRHGYHLR